jgi:hypothetical protein
MKKIKEQIDYGGRRERMDPNLERKLGDPEGMYSKNPAMKKGVQDVQRLVSSRFGKVVDKLKRVTGIEEITPQVFRSMLVSEMMNRTSQTISIESRHREELEQLAIEVCLDETETEPDWYVIEAYLNRQPIDVSNFRYQPEEEGDEEEEEEEEDEKQTPQFPSFDIEDLTPQEELELEKHKRNIINALIQGAAKKGHYLFQKPEVKSRLDAIDPSLYQNYLAIMAVNDYLYFSMEQMIEMMSQTGQGVAGKVELDTNDEGDDEGGEETPDTVIRAYGLIFPIVCHEIIKGIEEAQGRHGLPKDAGMRQKVLGQTDILSNEPMQLRIGPEIQEKIRFALPDEMYDEANKGLMNWFKVVFYQIPAKEFLAIVGNAISEDESKVKKATARFTEIMKEAMELKNEYDEWKSEQSSDEEGPQSNDDEDDDDDIDDFLDSLGIVRPK